ncbi:MULTISPECIES: thioredoxin family protein [Flavobacterium]|uniref:Thiol reductase thioredoxin n=1 Tax=Flavobacterium aurantiibacter TaxID=2023067 RepID=A0A255ZZE1_9FLAO|nr:thioredoxin family protein [Flavobacterium aurantiibacter]OYQ46853.1 thiol reductase thioredoxin [Flavobacterium aurantiibacter]
MLVELTADNLSELVAQNAKVVVQYSASWCGNCRIMKPKFKVMSEQHTDKVFAIVDAEKFPESRKLANVSNLPTFATFVDGKLVDQIQTNKVEGLTNLVNEISVAS